MGPPNHIGLLIIFHKIFKTHYNTNNTFQLNENWTILLHFNLRTKGLFLLSFWNQIRDSLNITELLNHINIITISPPNLELTSSDRQVRWKTGNVNIKIIYRLSWNRLNLIMYEIKNEPLREHPIILRRLKTGKESLWWESFRCFKSFQRKDARATSTSRESSWLYTTSLITRLNSNSLLSICSSVSSSSETNALLYFDVTKLNT